MRTIRLGAIVCATIAAALPGAVHAATSEDAASLTSAFEGVAMADTAMTAERGGAGILGFIAFLPKGSTTRIDIDGTSSGTNTQPGNPSHSKTSLNGGGTTASAEASLSDGGPVTSFNLLNSFNLNSSLSTTRSFEFSQVTGQ
jgi:hypothetical protein